MVVTAPKDGTEMIALLRAGLAHTGGPFALRYPRDAVPDAPVKAYDIPATPFATWEVLRQGKEFAVLATGTMVLPALAAAKALAAEGLNLTVVNCRFIKPYDEVTLHAIAATHKNILTVEEGTVVNGFGAYMSSVIGAIDPAIRVSVHGVPDRFIEQAPRKVQLQWTGLDAAGIAARVRALLESEAVAG
jgi:1-deoxy-D-xylulose-5-phosphate synthase